MIITVGKIDVLTCSDDGFMDIDALLVIKQSQPPAWGPVAVPRSMLLACVGG